MNTKLHAVTDTNGRPIRFFMTAGQVSDYTGARALVNTLPAADWLLGDRGYDADWFREALIDKEKNALHSRTEVTRRTRQIRQAPLHEAQPDRSHVRAIEGLETRSHALRPKPQSVPLSDRSRRNSDFSVISADPTDAAKIVQLDMRIFAGVGEVSPRAGACTLSLQKDPDSCGVLRLSKLAKRARRFDFPTRCRGAVVVVGPGRLDGSFSVS